MGSGFSKMKKQTRLLESKIQEMRLEMSTKEYTGTSGNGLVTVTLNGENNMKKLIIKPECIDPNDLEGLQDLIIAAYEEANKKISAEAKQELPAGLPFSF